MNNKVHIDAEILKLLYFKYKAYGIPIIGFLFIWIIFFQFVLPQIQNFFITKDEVTASEQTLATLTQNYNLIALQNEDEEKKYLAIATAALPQEKDFAGILTAISAAAGESGVIVNDYSFQIGDINSIIQKGKPDNQTVQISLTIKGSMDQTKDFLTALAAQFPLSEISSITMTSDGTAAITANFFYVPAQKVPFVDTNPLVVISAEQKKVLDTLSHNATTQISLSAVHIATPTPQLTATPVSTASSQ